VHPCFAVDRHHPGVVARRVLLFVVLLIGIGALACALTPRAEDQAGRQTLPADAPVSPAANLVEASLPGKADIRARVGDVVQLAVRHDARDIVQIPTLGVAEPVEPGLDALLVFDADRPGRFAVTLREAARRIGTVDVRAAG
jgi:hypothetical protein